METNDTNDSADALKTRYQEVMHRIEQAIKQRATPSSPVTLLAVSKTRTPEEMIALYQLGIKQFGENYLQEAEEKITALSVYLDIEWHFIGHLQSNKSRTAAHQFAWLHTLHSEKLAQRLNQYRPDHLPPLNVCIQINIDQEPTKSGIQPETLFPLAKAILALPKLSLRGLMAIPSPSSPETQNAFAAMQALLQQLKAFVQQEGGDPDKIDTLSMGMSNDLEEAIAYGSTIVRVGTALFGPRPPKQP